LWCFLPAHIKREMLKGNELIRRKLGVLFERAEFFSRRWCNVAASYLVKKGQK
jgi:hypothetical protein